MIDAMSLNKREWFKAMKNGPAFQAIGIEFLYTRQQIYSRNHLGLFSRNRNDSLRRSYENYLNQINNCISKN